jgi:hypothetical protein
LPVSSGSGGKCIRKVNEKMEFTRKEETAEPTKIFISKKYLAFLFILWIAPTISAIWGAPIYATITFMSFFAIYAGHEWMHIYVCKINKIDIESIVLSTGDESQTNFYEAEEPEKNIKEANVYLAGVLWDSFWLMISCLASIIYGFITQSQIPITLGFALILMLIFNLAHPGSDWQEYRKRTITN